MKFTIFALVGALASVNARQPAPRPVTWTEVAELHSMEMPSSNSPSVLRLRSHHKKKMMT